MQAFYGTRISDHISETPENFLVCHSAPLCRTGYQKYRGTELGLRTDDLVDVYRAPETVFSQKFLASLEGKPVTDRHPEEFLNADNAKWYMRGHAQNIREGPPLPDGEQSVIGDLVITDPALIQKIKSGVRDLSVGYTCEYTDNGDGTYSQTRLRANHVAVVESGRAGEHVRIMDGVTEEMLHSSESRSFDDLADEIHQSYNPSDSEEEDEDEEIEEEGFTMPKTDHLEAMVRRIVTQEISKLMPREQSLVEEVADAHPSLAKLRLLRPIIEASGDRQAIDAYNRAIRAVKKLNSTQSSHLVSAVDARRAEADASSEFAAAARQLGARMRGEEEREPEKKPFGKRAADSLSRSDDEEWHKHVNAMGSRMREGKIR